MGYPLRSSQFSGQPRQTSANATLSRYSVEPRVGSTPAANSLRSLPIPFLRHQSEPLRSRLAKTSPKRAAIPPAPCSLMLAETPARPFVAPKVATIRDRAVSYRAALINSYHFLAHSQRPQDLQIVRSATCARTRASASAASIAVSLVSGGRPSVSNRRQQPNPFTSHHCAPLRSRRSAVSSHERTSLIANVGASDIAHSPHASESCGASL